MPTGGSCGGLGWPTTPAASTNVSRPRMTSSGRAAGRRESRKDHGLAAEAHCRHPSRSGANPIRAVRFTAMHAGSPLLSLRARAGSTAARWRLPRGRSIPGSGGRLHERPPTGTGRAGPADSAHLSGPLGATGSLSAKRHPGTGDGVPLQSDEGVRVDRPCRRRPRATSSTRSSGECRLSRGRR